MKRTSPASAFTLIEMLTVMVVIIILASLVIAVNGFAQANAARNRAKAEIASMSLGLENYKQDNGTYPRSDDTDNLDPKTEGKPTSTSYQKSCLWLYKKLSGDDNADYKADTDKKVYLTEFFKPSVLNTAKTSGGDITGVNYIQDPFGNCYGYSTMGAAAEEKFENDARTNPSISRSGKDYDKGYNTTFDLWSTGGSVTNLSGGGAGGVAAAQAKWVKNW